MNKPKDLFAQSAFNASQERFTLIAPRELTPDEVATIRECFRAQSLNPEIDCSYFSKSIEQTVLHFVVTLGDEARNWIVGKSLDLVLRAVLRAFHAVRQRFMNRKVSVIVQIGSPDRLAYFIPSPPAFDVALSAVAEHSKSLALETSGEVFWYKGRWMMSSEYWELTDCEPTPSPSATLTKKNKKRLGNLIVKLYENAHKTPKDSRYIWNRQEKGIRLDDEGGRYLNEAIQVIQSVPKWKEAYPSDAVMKRIIDAMFEGGELHDVLSHIIDSLDQDCKPIRAYVPFFGFHLEENVQIRIGPYVLRNLGEEGVEREIIGRLNEHLRAAGWNDEESEKERERYRQHLLKFPNVPILLVEFYGSVDGAREFVRPVADYVGLFIQFCIGALTDRFFDNPVIVDYTGRFTGDWATFMPVMTAEYDRLDFPNLLGFHPDFSFSREDVERLRLLGVLEMGDEFLKEVKSNNSIDNLLVRAMCSFADGERAISKLSRMSAYVTASEVFFSRRLPGNQTTVWVTVGMAAANSENESEYEQTLDYARAIYDDRSRALHDGFEPRWTYIARKLALGSIFRMLAMRDQLTTRKKVQAWLKPRVERLLSKAPQK